MKTAPAGRYLAVIAAALLAPPSSSAWGDRSEPSLSGLAASEGGLELREAVRSLAVDAEAIHRARGTTGAAAAHAMKARIAELFDAVTRAWPAFAGTLGRAPAQLAGVGPSALRAGARAFSTRLSERSVETRRGEATALPQVARAIGDCVLGAVRLAFIDGRHDVVRESVRRLALESRRLAAARGAATEEARARLQAELAEWARYLVELQPDVAALVADLPGQVPALLGDAAPKGVADFAQELEARCAVERNPDELRKLVRSIALCVGGVARKVFSRSAPIR